MKKGGVVHAVTVKVAADKKSAVLERGADFVNGKYEVAVKLDGKEVLKKEIEIKAEEATSIVIKSDKIAKDTAVALDVEILNQYKEKLTGVNPINALTAVAKNKTEPGRTVTVNNALSYDTTKCEMGDEIEITIFLNADTSVRVTKVVPVGYVAPQGTDVAFGEVVMVGAKTEINPNDKGIKLPMTIKKNGSEIAPAADVTITNPGDDLNAAFTGENLKVFFDTKVMENIEYQELNKALVFDIKSDAKAGIYNVKIINKQGVEYTTNFEIKKLEAPARIEAVDENINVSGGENFNVAFKLIGDRGNELKWSDFAAANVKELKQEKADGSAGNVANTGVWAAPKMPYTAAAASGKITFILNDGTNDIEGSTITVNVKVIPIFNSIEVDTDPSTASAPQTLKAGQKFTVIINAKNGGSLYTTYNEKWEGVKIGYGGAGSNEITLSRDVQFVNGVAKIELVAKKSTAGKLKVTMPDAASTAATTVQNITVNAGDVAKLTVAKNAGDDKKLDLEVFDLEDNALATYTDTLDAVVSLPSLGLHVAGPAEAVIDSEGIGTIKFTNGKIVLELNKARVKGLYRVELTLTDGTKVVGEYTEE